VKTDASYIERWIRLANLLPPDVTLLPPAIVEEGWNPRPRSKVLRRAWLRQRHDSDPRSAELLTSLWRAWQKQFGKPAGRRSFVPGAIPKKIAKAFEAQERAGSLPVAISLLVKRRRGRPRKGEQSGIQTHSVEWKPFDERELYSLFYAVRTSLETIARAAANPRHGEPTVVDIPVSATIFITPSGTSLFRGASGQFLEDVVRAGLSRIRKCPICSRIYYARRIDKGACSPRCCDTLNARKFRSPEKRRQYEANRKRYRSQRFKAKERIMLSATLRRIQKESRKGE
jgi:hypothetical protein